MLIAIDDGHLKGLTDIVCLIDTAQLTARICINCLSLVSDSGVISIFLSKSMKFN